MVFPTGVDVRGDGALDVYYGMADSRIGVARTTLTDLLLPAAPQQPGRPLTRYSSCSVSRLGLAPAWIRPTSDSTRLACESGNTR